MLVGMLALATWLDHVVGYDAGGLGYRHVVALFHLWPMTILCRRFNDTGIPRNYIWLPILAFKIVLLAHLVLLAFGGGLLEALKLTTWAAAWAYLLTPILMLFPPSKTARDRSFNSDGLDSK